MRGFVPATSVFALSIVDNDELAPIASDVRARLRRVVERAANA
jgi:hypothetical protein